MSAREHIKSLLDQGHSKLLRNDIIEYVGHSKARMKALMHFFFHKNMQYNQRSSWAVGEIGVADFKMVEPYLDSMIKAMSEHKHDAIVRNVLRIFENMDIPEQIEGPLCDKCFEYLENPHYAIAIRAFSLSVLHRIVKKHPDLQPELIALIEEHLPHGTAAFKVRSRRILSDLRQ